MCTNRYFIEKQRCRDGVINDFLSQYRHLLVPLLYHDVTSLHPPSFQRNDLIITVLIYMCVSYTLCMIFT